jgi:hypothetical protein
MSKVSGSLLLILLLTLPVALVAHPNHPKPSKAQTDSLDRAWADRVKSHKGIHIKAWIDGADMVHLKGHQLWYEHHAYVLPGKWGEDQNGPNDKNNLPTYVNGTSWYPKWLGLISERYSHLHPPLPQKADSAVVVQSNGRGHVTVVQYPSQENDYTLSIFLEDDPPGAAWYEVLIQTNNHAQEEGRSSPRQK